MSENDDRLDQAQRRIAAVAVKLTRLFPTVEVAGLFAGAAIALMTATYGRARAEEYISELAAELKADDGAGEVAGHA